MPTHNGLLRAILQDPEDNSLRLIYADWLEDNGDPIRAEFIRLGIAYAENGWTDRFTV
jgi:uncharacterized protein (TIGR02996 family)